MIGDLKYLRDATNQRRLRLIIQISRMTFGSIIKTYQT